MKYDSLIFDLDGTLWKTGHSCAVAWNHILDRNGISFRRIMAEDVMGVAGLPHEECIRKVFASLSEEQIQILLEQTTEEDNAMIHKHGGVIYSGVAEGLEALNAQAPLFIVSNCQKGYIEAFLEYSGFSSLFKDFECWGNTGRVKGENIQSVIDRNQLKSTIYIGDTEGDYQAAMDCSISFIQVTYGFGRPMKNCQQIGSFSQLVNELLEK